MDNDDESTTVAKTIRTGQLTRKKERKKEEVECVSCTLSKSNMRKESQLLTHVQYIRLRVIIKANERTNDSSHSPDRFIVVSFQDGPRQGQTTIKGTAQAVGATKVFSFDSHIDRLASSSSSAVNDIVSLRWLGSFFARFHSLFFVCWQLTSYGQRCQKKKCAHRHRQKGGGAKNGCTKELLFFFFFFFRIVVISLFHTYNGRALARLSNSYRITFAYKLAGRQAGKEATQRLDSPYDHHLLTGDGRSSKR